MTFGDDKCAYQQIENGRLLQCTDNLEINQLPIKPIKEGDTYKYLGIDKNINYVGLISKHRITKKYYHRIKKIWNSELLSFNKVIQHNTFASHNGDADRLYIPKSKEGRGLKSIVRIYRKKIASVV